MLYEIIDSFVLQSYGIDHTRRRFGHSGIRIAFSGFQRRSFDDNTAQSGQIDKIGKLQTISECSGRSHNGIFQRQPPYIYF